MEPLILQAKALKERKVHLVFLASAGAFAATISLSSSGGISNPVWRRAATMRRPFSAERSGKMSTSWVVPG
jgi:hypothetical protein